MVMAEIFDGVIGIDLGTTYSCVAVFLHNQVEVIANSQGNRTTPSCVAFHKSDVLVGDSAKDLSARGQPGVVYDAKHMIGRRYSDADLQDNAKRWPFTVSAGENDRVQIEVEVQGETLRLAPEQISAMILSYLKDCAEAYLGKQVKKAVITVPAYFNDAQRERTKAAATIAGLDVLRIVNEPTAAALCYGLGISTGAGEAPDGGKPRNVLVFDFGGGTFDVSVITIDSGSFAVRATAGDTHLGGEDIDNQLVEYVAADLRTRHNVDVTAQRRLLAKTRVACEHAKRVLSHATTTELSLDGVLPDGEEYAITLSRSKLEELCSDVFNKCLGVLKRALKDAGMEPGEMDEVILVGGSTRIPKLHSMLTDFFGGKRLCNSINADEAVAMGAAVQASILSHDEAQRSAKTANVVLMDVVPLSIGVEVDNGKFDRLIPRNTTIPYKATKEYTTVENNQEAVDIRVFEGERPLTKHNHHLGEFSLEGISQAKKGTPTVTVTFAVDANGLLTITASEDMGQKSKSLVVQNTERLSDAEVQAMIEMAKKFQKDDEMDVARQESRAKVLRAIDVVERAIQEQPNPDGGEEPRRVVEKCKAWLEKQLPLYTDASELERRRHKVLKHLRKTLKSLNKGRARDDADDIAPPPKRPREKGDGSSSDEDDGASSGDDNSE